MDQATKSNRDVEIKQERMDTSSSHEEEEESPLGSGKTKKLRIEVADAESNTLNSGKFTFHLHFTHRNHCKIELFSKSIR